MGPDGKLYFCTTISNNTFRGSLLSVIDGWLKHLYQETTSRADDFLFFGKFRCRDVLMIMNSYISLVEKMLRQDTTWRICRRQKKILKKEKIYVSTIFSNPSITGSKEPQNVLQLIEVPKQSFPREPSLLYSAKLVNKRGPPPSTGLMGRPLGGHARTFKTKTEVYHVPRHNPLEGARRTPESPPWLLFRVTSPPWPPLVQCLVTCVRVRVCVFVPACVCACVCVRER